MAFLPYEIISENIDAYIKPLDQALYHHERWFNDLIRTLVCRLEPDQHDLAEDAHKKCRFNQWYNSINSDVLLNHEGFIAIGKAHQHMHRLAKKILLLNGSTDVPPFEFDNFSASLKRFQLEIHSLKRELDNLIHNTDPLTKTINKVNLLPSLRKQHALTLREQQECTLVMVDIDHFKAFNDNYGHQLGDQVLAEFAKKIIQNLRPYDKVFRYGGEEFIICLINTPIPKAQQVIERMRLSLSENPILITNGHELSITASFGIAQLDTTVSIETSIERADKAMYAAKKNGRDCIKIWDEKLS